MYKTKIIALGGLMACIAALFQVLPVFLSEAFVILTIFSAIPIYITAVMNPKAGIAALITAFLLINLFSAHEALFFICTNGPVGITLGICSHYDVRKIYTAACSSAILSVTLCIMNFIIGIPVFGSQISYSMWFQISIIVIFSLIYNLIYMYFCRIIFNRIAKAVKFISL